MTEEPTKLYKANSTDKKIPALSKLPISSSISNMKHAPPRINTSQNRNVTNFNTILSNERRQMQLSHQGDAFETRGGLSPPRKKTQNKSASGQIKVPALSLKGLSSAGG